MIFTEGTEVIYKDFQGIISFVCDTYVVVQITTKPGFNSPGLVVYREYYEKIKISKASEK
tara:strand:- start:2976 stop:3155 length:180 start_codon:yes stop_codon:yes gene_type:complete